MELPPTIPLGSLLDGVRDAVVIAELDTGRIVFWNHAAEAVFGYSANEASSMPVETLVPTRLKTQHRMGIERYNETGRGQYIDSHMPVELPALRKTGEEITVEVSFSPTSGSDGGHLAVAVIRDVTERKRLEEQVAERTRELVEANTALKDLAERDTLTGLANRHRALEVVEKYLSLARRHARPLALASLDLDNFKRVNDTHSHMAGDKVLAGLGGLLRNSFRGEDVVARWGGEEFVVAMFGMNTTDGIERLQALLDAFKAERFISPDGDEFHVTFSAGVAEFPQDGSDLQSLYLAADRALYKAKGLGRDCVVAASGAS